MKIEIADMKIARVIMKNNQGSVSKAQKWECIKSTIVIKQKHPARATTEDVQIFLFHVPHTGRYLFTHFERLLNIKSNYEHGLQVFSSRMNLRNLRSVRVA